MSGTGGWARRGGCGRGGGGGVGGDWSVAVASRRGTCGWCEMGVAVGGPGGTAANASVETGGWRPRWGWQGGGRVGRGWHGLAAALATGAAGCGARVRWGREGWWGGRGGVGSRCALLPARRPLASTLRGDGSWRPVRLSRVAGAPLVATRAGRRVGEYRTPWLPVPRPSCWWPCGRWLRGGGRRRAPRTWRFWFSPLSWIWGSSFKVVGRGNTSYMGGQGAGGGEGVALVYTLAGRCCGRCPVLGEERCCQRKRAAARYGMTIRRWRARASYALAATPSSGAVPVCCSTAGQAGTAPSR